MVSGSQEVGGAAQRFGVVKRIALKVSRLARGLIQGHDLKRGPVAVKHCEARAPPHLFNHVGQRGAEFFGADRNIHIKAIIAAIGKAWLCSGPGGTEDNSPAFQRWVCTARRTSPGGTIEIAVVSRPFGT